MSRRLRRDRLARGAPWLAVITVFFIGFAIMVIGVALMIPPDDTI